MAKKMTTLEKITQAKKKDAEKRDKAAAILDSAREAGTLGKNKEQIKVIETRGKDNFQKLNMQKKKEDVAEAALPSEVERKANSAKKNLQNYLESEEQQKKNADMAARAMVYGVSDEGGEYKPDETLRRLQDEVTRADAAVTAYEKARTAEKNARIAERDSVENWSDEDKEALEQYINDKQSAFVQSLNPAMTGLPADFESNPLIAKYGRQRLDQIASTYQRQQNKQKFEDAETAGQNAADNGTISAIGANAASIGANLADTLLNPLTRIAQSNVGRDDRYSTIDPYAGGQAAAYAAGVRQKTAENIEGDEYDEQGNLIKEGGTGRQIGSYIYQGGMSALDSAARALISGSPTAGASLAALGSFNQTLREASEKGATAVEAVALATVNSAIEAATEKLPLDNLFDIARAGAKPVAKVVMNILKQAGIEILEEEASLVGTTLAEAAILQEKSDYNQQIAKYVENGFSLEQAKKQVLQNFLAEALNTAIISGISGGFGGLGASGFGAKYVGAREAEADPTQEIVDAVAAELAQQAPQQEAQPVSPEAKLLDTAIAKTLGIQTETQSAVDTATAAEYDNNTITVPGATVGRSDVTYTADNKPVQFQYAVVPAVSLVTSNDQYGNVNSAYPAELQPRDRTRTASQTQINSISRNLNPALLAESPTAQNGAPIIRGDGVVIGGNGRVSAIAQAYGAGRGAEYQQFITEKAAELGIDPATLPANPVLVRVTNGVDNYTELANSLNASTTASYSATEAANADASRIGDIIEYLSVSDDGGINTAANKDFIQKFVAQVVPETERGDVMQANGQISQAGERRIQNALFAYAYGDTALVERLAESTDNNAKNITNAMVGAAGKVAQLQTEINRGEVQNLGLQNAITDAVNLYLDAKAGKQTVEDAAGQLSIGDNGPEAQYDGLTVNLAKFMESNNRSGKQIRDFIDTLIDVNMNATADTATEISMFDTGEQQTQEGLYDEAVTAYDQQRDGKGRIPEKSDFSQYRQYEPGKLAGGVVESRTEGNAGTAVPDGRIPQTVPADASGGQRLVKGTGAAEANFSAKPAYNATLSADNAQPDRRTDVRPMELPRQDVNGGNISAVTGDVYGSQNTPNDLASAMEEPTARGDFSYIPISNDEATQRAQKTIEDAGSWATAEQNFHDDVRDGKAGAEISARGALILNHAAEVYQQAKQTGNPEATKEAQTKWLSILSDLRQLGTNTAQGLQAMRIIRSLMPEDKLEFAKTAVRNMVRDMKLKTPIQIDENLLTEYENATTDEQRDEVIGKIQKNVAKQIPSTLLDKWNALRYTNMLGNLKTQTRNFAGNVGSTIAYRVKDATGAAIESLANSVSGGKVGRTKSVIVSRPLQKACDAYYQKVKTDISSGAKFSENRAAQDDFTQGVMDERRIFKSNAKNENIRKVADFAMAPMEAYRKGTNWMMNNKYFGDEAFGKAAFTHAMAGYLQANGVKTEADMQKADPALIDKAMAYAVKEAQETTFHDNSALARVFGKLKNDLGVVGEGIAPFTKTPSNVLIRAEEFSPLGLINTAVLGIKKAAGNTKISGTDIINSLSKSLTGSMIFALGAVMKRNGMLSAGADEDEEKAAFDKEVGKQEYAIVMPDGTSYTFDWATPEALPLFMGAQFMELMQEKDDGITFADLEKVFTSIADPMIQMSMLQGINDSLDSIKYADSNLIEFVLNSSLNYLTQGLTNTLMGQIEKSTEETRQTTYVDKDSEIPAWMQRAFGKASQKIPGWDFQQTDYINARGETEQQRTDGVGWLYNLTSPGYLKKADVGEVEQELYRLHDATGENIFPESPSTTLTWTDKTGTVHKDQNLTAEQADTLKKTYGQTYMRLAGDIMKSKDYDAMSEEQAAKVLQQADTYARKKAEIAAIGDQHTGYDESWMMEMEAGAGADYIIRRVTKSEISGAMDALDTAWDKGYDTTGRSDDLKWAYDTFSKMSDGAKADAREWLTGTAAKYVEAREKGVSHDAFVAIAKTINDLPLEPTYTEVRDIQKREAIANNRSITEKEKDIIMKAYMPDYKPNAKQPQTTELKYDAIRELGVSPKGYTDAYRAYLDASGTGKRKRTIKQFMSDYGWNKSTATKVYDIYAGYYKPWE